MQIRLNQNALNRLVKTNLVERKVSRRDLFAGGAAAVASLSPGVQAAVVALAHGPITVKLLRRGNSAKAIVSNASGGSWTVDTALFAGSPVLTVEPGTKSTTVKLTGARYPGTQVAVNFEADIPHLASEKISFRFFDCGDGSASFTMAVRADGWLNGSIRATGSIDKNGLDGLFHDLQPGANVTSTAKGTIGFLASGQLKAVANMELATDENVWSIADFSLSSQARTPETLVSGKDKCHTVLTASKRDSWTGTVAMEAESGWQVGGSADAFDTWIAECHEGGSVATKFSGDGSLDVVLPGVMLLRAKSPSLTSLGQHGEDLHFASLLGEDGSWVHHDDVSLHAAPITSEPFILSTNPKGELHGEPVLHSRSVALTLEGAIVTVRLPQLPNMALTVGSSNSGKISQGRPPINQRPPITKPPVIPPAVQRPNVDTPIKTSSQVWIPSIEVVRPQDFLNLKFEFANLHLSSTQGAAPYFERETPSRPAYIIVEFPPQSIGEQSFFAGSTYQPPVRTLLSGPTRLVFYIPSTQKTVKFSLTEDGGLLDWSLWSLSVAPAAFSTFSGTVSIDPSWKHPIQDVRIGGSREFEMFAEKSPTITERLASIFQIQRQTTVDQGIKQIIQFPTVRQKNPNTIHFKPNILEVSPQKDPTKIIPGIPNGRTGSIYRYYTNIEIPAQIQMSPDENAHFFHERSPDTGPINARGPKRSAIWHTRLGSFANIAGKVFRAESSDDGEWFYMEDNQGRLGPYKASAPIHPNLRAIDSTDYDIGNNLSGEFSITRNQRKELVDTMTMRSGNPASDTPPFIADRLMLTSLGGFLKGAWTWGETAPPHNVVAWRHWSTLGREQFVYIREAGFLVPTGHRVDKVTITQRKFRSSGQGVVARLETKTYLIVTSPVVNLEPDAARKLGFSQIVCKTKTTPDLSFVGLLKLAGTTEVFEFAMVGTDMDGHQVSWTQPATFRLFNDGINASLTWSNAPVVQLKTSGHSIAFAPSQNPSDGTKFPCKEFSMGAIAGTPNPDKGIPAFRPTMASASINIPAVEQYLSGSNLGAVAVEFDAGYKNSGFTGGPEVFLSLKVGALPRAIASK